VFARQFQRLQPVLGAKRVVSMSFEKIMKQLHVQLVILNDENFLRHDLKHDAVAFPVFVVRVSHTL